MKGFMMIIPAKNTLTQMKSHLIAFRDKVNALPHRLSLLIHFLLVPILANSAINLFYFICNPFDGSRRFGGILFSYLFSVLLYAFFLTAFRKAKIASTVLSVLYFVLGYVNQIKMVISGMNPLFLSDLFFVSDAASLAVMVGYSDLGGTVIDYLPETLFFLFLLTLAVLSAFFFNYRMEKPKPRFVTLSVTFLLLLLVFIPIKPIHSGGYSLFFGKKAGHDPVDFYSEQGFLSGIVAQYWNSHPIVDDQSDPAKELLQNLPENTDGTWGSPNIIMVFSESFFDLSKLEDVTFSEEPCRNFNALKSEGISFSMLSPTIGGLSCNSEYQFLSGGNIGYYPLGFVPYTMMYQDNNENRFQYPSYIEELRNNGYKTEIVSTWQKNLCNCDTVYESMGLDVFLYEYGDEIKGLYYSDVSTANVIKKTFDEKPTGEKLFYFTQTAQAHMPYYYEKYPYYDIEVTSSPLNEKENSILTSYAQGIYDADKMLADLYSYIKTLSEPTVLVFFGDHLPTLRDCSVDLFDKLAYFNTDDKLLNEARRHTTEGLILANFPIEDDVDYIGQDLLITYLLKHTELDLSPYYRYLADTLDTAPVIGTFAAYAPDGTLYSLDALPPSIQKTYEERRILQYFLFQ